MWPNSPDEVEVAGIYLSQLFWALNFNPLQNSVISLKDFLPDTFWFPVNLTAWEERVDPVYVLKAEIDNLPVFNKLIPVVVAPVKAVNWVFVVNVDRAYPLYTPISKVVAALNPVINVNSKFVTPFTLVEPVTERDPETTALSWIFTFDKNFEFREWEELNKIAVKQIFIICITG